VEFLPKKPDRVLTTENDAQIMFETMKTKIIIPLIILLEKLQIYMNEMKNMDRQKVKNIKITILANCIEYVAKLKIIYMHFFKIFIFHFLLPYNTITEYNAMSGQYAKIMKFKDYQNIINRNTGVKGMRTVDYTKRINNMLLLRLGDIRRGDIPFYESILKQKLYFF